MSEFELYIVSFLFVVIGVSFLTPLMFVFIITFFEYLIKIIKNLKNKKE